MKIKYDQNCEINHRNGKILDVLQNKMNNEECKLDFNRKQRSWHKSKDFFSIFFIIIHNSRLIIQWTVNFIILISFYIIQLHIIETVELFIKYIINYNPSTCLNSIRIKTNNFVSFYAEWLDWTLTSEFILKMCIETFCILWLSPLNFISHV